MPEYLAPGVYVEEVEMGGKPIEGVSTTTAGFIGETERGPTRPTLVTGLEQFRRLYGDFISNSYLPYAVDGFFGNGGKRCFIARVVGEKSESANLVVEGKAEGAQPVADSAAGTQPTVTFKLTDEDLKKLRPILKLPDEEFKKLESLKGRTFRNESLFLKEVDQIKLETQLNDEQKKEISKQTKKTAESSQKDEQGSDKEPEEFHITFRITAIGPGKWGDRVAVKVEKASLYHEKRNPNVFKMTVIYWKDDLPKDPTDPKKVIAVDPTDPKNDRDPNRMEPSLIEVYDNLSPMTLSSDFYEKRINDISALIRVEKSDKKITLRNGEIKFLGRGPADDNDDEIKLSDYEGKNGQGERTGLRAFEEVDEISMVCAPNENDDDLQGLTKEIIIHCELMKDRFAIIQAKQTAGPVGDLFPPEDSKYAAFYYPWVKVIDPLTNSPKLIPPGGHIAGIYARSDIERGVHKAPANEVVRGVLGLQFPLTKGEQDILNPRGVNCIRAFRGRGIRVWGARTVSSDPIWKYVNVRRLFLYIEESIDEGTQWVVFEPNDQRLWARVKQGVTDFLTRVWKDGALMGTTPDEAFFVKCDETTMTRDDIDNGRLIILIGVAPVKPAEYVIFRIAQWRGGSAAIE